MRAALLVLALLCGATDHAFGRMGSGQVVFQGNKVDLGYLTDNASSTGDSAAGSPLDYQRSRKIAIIGAGPGGSSAAYFLSKAQSKLESLGYGAEGLDITLFEREERIGGRTAVVHPYGDESMPAIELGASIFADVNKNLQRASRQFKLATGAKIGEPGITGIWDGQQFLIEGLDNGWWNSAKMFWRYGYSPVTTQKLVGKLVDAFLHLYDPTYMHRTGHDAQRTESGYPWSSIEDLARAMKLDDVAAQSAGDYFYGSGVSKLFIEEIIEAATLVNYGQEIYSIHGVGGSVSLAASGATGVVGGNYQIFESMIGHSEALKLRMGSHGEVTGLARFRTVQDAIDAGKVDTRDALAAGLMDEQTGEMTSSGQTTKWWLGTKSGYGGLFDAVFIAAPWHSAEITLLNTHAVIPAPPYVRLHVTIVITKSDQPDPAYFGRGEKDKIPTEVLTSHISVRKEKEEEEKKKERKDRGGEKDGGDDGDDDGVRKNRTARWWPWGGDDKKRGPHLEFNSLTYLAALPSRTEPDKEDHVVKIFSPEALSDERLQAIFGKDNVVWTYRKEWDAYPYLLPKRQFPKVQIDDNLFFLNAMETLVSTMETATVSARNAVALYLQKEYGSDFVHGGKDCPWEKQSADNGSVDTDIDWAAWGCQSA